MEELLTLLKENWLAAILLVVGFFKCFKKVVEGIEWFIKKFGFETKSMRKRRENEERLGKTEKDIEEIKEASKRNVQLFLEHEQQVVGKFTGIRDEIIVELNKLRDRMDEQQAESEAKAARMRIQRFADELYGNVLHSKEHFDLILMDITAYNNYCDAHPGFVNEKTKFAQDIIADRYEQCLREHSFRG